MNKKQSMFAKEYAWRGLMTAGGLLVIVITICIGAFLVYKGSGTFTIFHHSLSDFLFSADWGPADNAEGGGTVGALIFIVGSLCTCGLALLIATPFALGSAICMIEIAPKFGEKFYRPIVEIFAGIPSVVYGWVTGRTFYTGSGNRTRTYDISNDQQCGSRFYKFCSERLSYGGLWTGIDQMAVDL